MTPLWALKDALSRIQRAREAMEDGDAGLAEHILEDLVHDVWHTVEALEREGA